jgi:preprotein translocase subunit SecF
MYKLKIIAKRNTWFTISGILVGLSLIALVSFGLNLGIDFTGGSLLEVQFASGTRPDVEKVRADLNALEIKSLVVQPTDRNGLILRFQEVDEDTHQNIISKLKELSNNTSNNSTEDNDNTNLKKPAISVESTDESDISINNIEIQTSKGVGVEELRFESVGPAIGQELRHKSIYAMIIVLLSIIAYVAWAFRKVSKPVVSWKYGVASILALFHDIIIVLGLFAVLGRYMDVEINTAFVAAILMVLGYSVNDTIVVFDRVRENLPKSDSDFDSTVNSSLNQTITRSINTSVTTLLVLLSIILLGGDSIHYFAVALFTGAFVGTYSSIFLASPLLVLFEKMKK